MTAPAIILHFLSYARTARVDTLTRYMEREWNIAPGTTRNTLSELAREGKIERVRRGRYARV